MGNYREYYAECFKSGQIEASQWAENMMIKCDEQYRKIAELQEKLSVYEKRHNEHLEIMHKQTDKLHRRNLLIKSKDDKIKKYSEIIRRMGINADNVNLDTFKGIME